MKCAPTVTWCDLLAGLSPDAGRRVPPVGLRNGRPVSWQMVFVSDTGSQQKQAQGKRSQWSLCRANQPGYLTAYALLWPTPAEGWRLHHGPWTPPPRTLLTTAHHSFRHFESQIINEGQGGIRSASSGPRWFVTVAHSSPTSRQRRTTVSTATGISNRCLGNPGRGGLIGLAVIDSQGFQLEQRSPLKPAPVNTFLQRAIHCNILAAETPVMNFNLPFAEGASPGVGLIKGNTPFQEGGRPRTD
ncbi:unnamed protein product [Pleuronectes platessa]|uniref:Uncharacterized protein n=1 Tax=Pleuronectes platessa TaxID=8262 RepID=A0A9N7Z758_PLEPL|nr:unnamed protein product [Pleuronectes platessa]